MFSCVVCAYSRMLIKGTVLIRVSVPILVLGRDQLVELSVFRTEKSPRFRTLVKSLLGVQVYMFFA
jgi:hypothetical protein